MEEIVFKWKIQNVSMCPLLTGEYLSSPTFYIQATKETKQVELSLKLYPRGHNSEYNDQMTISLFKCNNETDNISMHYRLSAFNNRALDVKDEYSHKFDNFSQRHMDSDIWEPEYFLRLYRKDICMLDDNITVECKILFISGGNIPSYDLDDLEDLSRCFANMLEEGAFSDMNIRTPNEDLKVHAFLLKSRCSALVEDRKILTKFIQQHPGSWDKAIKTLLRYLYTGKFKYSDLPEEFHTFLKQLDSSVFEHLLSASCIETYADTLLEIETFKFEWKIENVLSTLRGEKRSFSVTKPSPRGIFEIKLFFHDGSNGRCLHFRIHKMCNRTNVFMYCSISFIRNGGERSFINHNHSFRNEERDWEISTDVKTSDFHLGPDGALNLNFFVKTSSGEYTTGVTENVYTVNNDFSSNKKYLYGLARDLRELRANPICSDFCLMVRRKTFRAHKAVLSARSPVFNKMLEHDFIEKQESKVIIEGLKANTVDSMLSYMYCGEVEILDVDSAFDLYLAADKYEILKLRAKCARYIQQSLKPENVGQILIRAHKQHDQQLKDFVYDSVCRNAELLSQRSHWFQEIQRHPELVAEIEQTFSKYAV